MSREVSARGSITLPAPAWHVPRRARTFLFKASLAIIYGFMLLPIVIVVGAAVNAGEYLTFPPQGFSLRWFVRFFESGPFVRAFVFSLRLGALTTLSSTLIGTLAALYLVRHASRYREALRMFMVSPLLFPAILTGVALLIYYYGLGMGGGSYAGLLIGHVLVTVPYVFLAVTTTLYNFDRTLEEAARSLGASRAKTFFLVTLPIIKGGIFSGAIFSFIVSFDQFPISLLLKGVGTIPLPIQLYDYLRFSFDPTAAAVSTISILLAVAVVLVTERFVGLESLYWRTGR
ncbi:MAG: ABC transporter permease [Armatimonadetes bacterium]|nr:ABC transporter permease [Armatimonadota bacterium]